MPTSSREVPKELQQLVLKMPEYSYGVNRIVVTLDDGTEFGDVFVAWGSEIVKVGDSEELPFDPAKIVRVRRQ